MKKNKKIIFFTLLLIIFSFLIFFLLNQYKLINYEPNNTLINNNILNSKFEEIKEVKVAFIGDQGYGNNAQAVLNLIKNEKTDFVLHQGDFDYTNNPEVWDNQINNILGESFPYFVSVGNHDLKAWEGYQKKLIDRINKIDGVNCQGDIGVKSSCEFMGIFFVLSGIGTLDTNHETYIRNKLNSSDDNWKICSWHKNQTLMQLGGKGNEVGWEAYDICRESGAIIATGHEHSYSRTYLMKNFANQEIVNTSNIMEISNGETFAFVSGLGGKNIRNAKNNLDKKPWWASVYTSDNNANFGALFCIFNYKNNSNQSYCYFKNINNKIIDEFNLIKK